MELAERLKWLRTRHGLSQRELARRAGVNNSLISQIEQAAVNPSVATLKRVLDGFPISMGEFFSLEQAPRRQVFFRGHELVPMSSGQVQMWLVGPLHGRRLALQRELYPPGADTGPGMLSNEAEEAGLVLRGEIEVTVGEHCCLLRAGDGYYFDTREPHRFRNIGTEVCELVSAATPPTF
ncbi:XRE family transcriptional regulator [Zobellella denitrificans]|jgi:transcriptional regulator with XRE-family HTH domain|uniref:XRE family transcriptional regulator n=1 Tax=Zobellella denitrificans TaxID=347534 RepID=A0A231MXF5_9GAMM|nr:cupin domain-containing protein [Zobellella denitrificans]ATG74363.1 XRE family transcriptional regulator [Zobellella denitrificans]OXS14286.1 XRE family transcriptional regulator [Zobellella denitrificans]